MDAIAARQFQFEGFTLDPLRRNLRTGGREVELRPKSFDVLLHLVESAGRLAAKDEIIAAVWPNVVATDESLARCVSDVRHALGDSGQTIIKTVPGRGYLFAVPVTVVAADAPATSATARLRMGRNRLPPERTAWRMASCTRQGSRVVWGRRSSSAASIRALRDR